MIFEYLALFLMFSTFWSWAFMADFGMVDFKNVTSWVGLIVAIPGIITTLILFSPLILFYLGCDKLNKMFRKD